jgi:hypothetical protein
MAGGKEVAEGITRGMAEIGAAGAVNLFHGIFGQIGEEANKVLKGLISSQGPLDDAKGAIILNRYRKHSLKKHQLLMELLDLFSKSERDGIVMVLIGIIAFTQKIEIEPPKADAKQKGKKGQDKPEVKQEDMTRYFEQLKVAKIDWSKNGEFDPVFDILDRLIKTFKERKQNGEFGHKQAVALLTEFNLYGDATLGKKVAGAITAWKRSKGQNGQFFEKLGDWFEKTDEALFKSGAEALAENAKEKADSAIKTLAENRRLRAEEKAEEEKLKDRERTRTREEGKKGFILTLLGF